jgi:hypothetical protein
MSPGDTPPMKLGGLAAGFAAVAAAHRATEEAASSSLLIKGGGHGCQAQLLSIITLVQTLPRILFSLGRVRLTGSRSCGHLGVDSDTGTMCHITNMKSLSSLARTARTVATCDPVADIAGLKVGRVPQRRQSPTPASVHLSPACLSRASAPHTCSIQRIWRVRHAHKSACISIHAQPNLPNTTYSTPDGRGVARCRRSA